MELDPQTHIYIYVYVYVYIYIYIYIFRISVTRGTSQAYLYGHILFCIQEKAKNGTFSRKNYVAIELKLWHATQLDHVNDMGVGPNWPHLFLFVCKAKNVKNVT